MSAPTIPPAGRSGEAAPAGDKLTVDLDETTARWLDYIRTCDQQIKELEESKKRARQHVEAALGEHEVGLVDGKPAVHWTIVTTSRFQQSKFREQHADLYEQFTAPQVTRRFTIGGDT